MCGRERPISSQGFLRLYILPPGAHGCDQTAHGGVSPEGDKSNLLPGRHPRPGRLLPEVSNKQGLCVKLLSGGRVLQSAVWILRSFSHILSTAG